MKKTVIQNMGITDRLIRGALGSILLMSTLRGKGKSVPVIRIIGSGLLTSSLAGHDPILSSMGLSTIGGSSNSIFNRLKATLPGQGINPILTQDVMPKRQLKEYKSESSVAEALAVG